MKYMVVECHPGYAVVLDDDGNFLKVANRKYEVGQLVTEVVPMQAPSRKKTAKWVSTLVAGAGIDATRYPSALRLGLCEDQSGSSD